MPWSTGPFFFLLTFGAHLHQASANLTAFLCAVTVSFFANARWTFSKPASPARFVRYTLFMACLALVTGWAGEWLSFAPFLTVGLFSALSLVIGYLYAHHVVFRDKQA
ncbi:GtrA family protein [Scandinavium lactucae]|uniref:GtrA family protein n=1 Tax=Scandinavium lactucae TaxID=3095028 RepID=A0AAJ2SA05_9ENTR|nr:GtrA family protein [Scandinavium sp. V105_12]MDX6033950.1 GtrA family protein [Scandinavium sp. V105_12]